MAAGLTLAPERLTVTPDFAPGLPRGSLVVVTVTYQVALGGLLPATPALTVSATARQPVQRFGSEALKRAVLPELAAGALGAFGLTEPTSGSDAGSLRTTARRDGDSWVLDGEKAWITNAGIARWAVVVARTDPEAGKRGLSAFLVGADAPGFAVGEPEEKLGLNASRTAPIVFTGCRVPAGHRPTVRTEAPGTRRRWTTRRSIAGAGT